MFTAVLNDAMRFLWLYFFLEYNLNQSFWEKTRKKAFILQEFLTWDSYFENFLTVNVLTAWNMSLFQTRAGNTSSLKLSAALV